LVCGAPLTIALTRAQEDHESVVQLFCA